MPHVSDHEVDEATIPTGPDAIHGARRWLRDRLRAVVLLSGSVRLSKLGGSIGRSILDLPIDNAHTILDRWVAQLHTLTADPRGSEGSDSGGTSGGISGGGGGGLGLSRVAVRVMINARSVPPVLRESSGSSSSGASSSGVTVDIEVDAGEYRGTAGVLKDLSQGYDDDDLILVANGPQIMLESLSDLVVELAKPRADVTLISHADGTPCGLMLVRCGVLKLVPELGFVDMKEQALPRIAGEHRVIVVPRVVGTAVPVRDLGDYIVALRAYHHTLKGDSSSIGAFTEDWRPTFGIIEPGAEVDPTALVHDSVVLRGAAVKRSSVLVRSVVCPGGVVVGGTTQSNRLVTPRTRSRGKVLVAVLPKTTDTRSKNPAGETSRKTFGITSGGTSGAVVAGSGSGAKSRSGSGSGSSSGGGSGGGGKR